ncbi:MAG: DUF2752 domain-containing protein [Victivallales bacterium]|nr:DUF2752 domain-containing protein [Victivallales bacterium]
MKKLSSPWLSFVWLALIWGVVAGVNLLFLGRAELCPTRMLFGIPCPGCGLGHSTLCLLQGRIMDSLAYCPLTIFVLLTLAAMLVLNVWQPRLSSRVEAVMRFFACSRMWHVLLLLAFLLLYAVRMLMYFPNGPYPMVYGERNYLVISRQLASKILLRNLKD